MVDVSWQGQGLQDLDQLVQFRAVVSTCELIRGRKALHPSLPVPIQSDHASVCRGHDGMAEVQAIVRRERVGLRLENEQTLQVHENERRGMMLVEWARWQ